MELFFDKGTHTYYVKYPGQEYYTQVPSVTTICGLGKFFPNNPQALAKGTLVHKLTEAYDNGMEIPENLSEEIRALVDNYKLFIKTYKPTYTHIESPVLGNINGLVYAGTVDRIGTIETSGAIRQCVIDIKTGNKAGYYAEQLAAYANAYYNDKRKEVYGMLIYVKNKLNIQFFTPSQLDEALKAFARKLQLYYNRERYE